MQYEIVIKGDGCCSCYTCLPQNIPTAQTTQKVVDAPGTSTGAPPVAQCLLTNTWPETRKQYKHTCKQRQKLRNSTTILKNSKQNKTKLELFNALQRSRGHKEHLKWS